MKEENNQKYNLIIILKMKYCSKCGAQCEDNEKFCHNCGSSLEVGQNYNNYNNNNYNNEQQPVSDGTLVGGFALGFFLALIGLVIALVACKKQTKTGAIVGFVLTVIINLIVLLGNYDTIMNS